MPSDTNRTTMSYRTTESVVKVLLAYAADELERSPHAAAFGDVPDELRLLRAGGSRLSCLEQNCEHPLPDTLDNFWRVLCAFECLAFGGLIVKGNIQPYMTGVEPVPAWMQHAAARALRARAATGDDLATGLLSFADHLEEASQAPYRRIGDRH